MDCAEVREEFSALLDGELTPEVRAAIEAHLSECAECLRELERFKQVDAAYRALPQHRAPADFDQRVAGALRPKAIRLRRPALRHRRVWPLLAAAAMVLVMLGGAFLQLRTPSGRFEVAQAPEGEKLRAEEPGKDKAVAHTKPTTTRGRGPVPAGAEETQEAELERTAAAEAPAPSPGEKGPPPAAPEQRFDVAKAAKDEGLRHGGRGARGLAEPAAAPLDAKTQKQLRALGYLGAGRPSASADADVGDQVRALREETRAPKPEPLIESDELEETPPAPAAALFAPAIGRPKAPAPVAARPAPTAQASPAPPAVMLKARPARPAEAEATRDQEPPRRVSRVALESPQGRASRPVAAERVSTLGYGDKGTAPSAGLPAEGATVVHDLVAVDGEALTRGKPRRDAGGRRFELSGGVWRQLGYKGQETVDLVRGSEGLEKLLDEYPKLRPLLELGDRVIFRHNRKWHKVMPAIEE